MTVKITIKTVTKKTFADFAKYLSNDLNKDDLLFRGQQTDEPLVPRIGRIKLQDGALLSDIERDLIQEFSRRAIPHLDLVPNDNWDWLALAQHHGMATRLLDWTTNPFAALWFAVEKPPKKNIETEELLPGVVWVFDASEPDYNIDRKTDPLDVPRTLVFRPNHITGRIVAQSGWFTVHKWMKQEKRFIPFEKNKLYKSKLLKIVIPPESFSPLRRELDRCGFNAGSLFPDVDGLCRHLQWQKSLLDDE